MKIYNTYICDVCGKESRNRNEIELCEASHMGLTIEEKRHWDILKESVKSCGFLVGRSHNLVTEEMYDREIERLIAFEKLHGIKSFI